MCLLKKLGIGDCVFAFSDDGNSMGTGAVPLPFWYISDGENGFHSLKLGE